MCLHGNDFRAVDLQCQRGPAEREKERGEEGDRERRWKQSPEVFLKSDPRAQDFITELRNQYD